MYRVSIAGDKVGIVSSPVGFDSYCDSLFIDYSKSIETKEDINFEYEKVFVNINQKEEADLNKISDNYNVLYKYYNIYIDNQYICQVNEIEPIFENITLENVTYSEEYTSAPALLEIQDTDYAIYLLENSEILTSKNITLLNAPQINGITLACTPLLGTISSRYNEVSRLRVSNHTGLDIAAKSGTEIRATANGTVTHSSYYGSYGNLVIIDHGNGVESYYGHCQKLLVNVGDDVKAGDIIATVGSTGNSTRPHLHFEIRLFDELVNPQDYLYIDE